jgi:hypothetical protein
MLDAEANITRLQAYARPNKSMTDDLAKHRRRRGEAVAELIEALKPAGVA